LARAIATRLEEAGWLVFSPGRAELQVSSADSVAAYFQSLPGPLDLLVNNAGITQDGPFARMAEEAWDQVLDTNLKGAFLCAQAALKGMIKQRRGHIVQIGSFSALRPPVGQANYAAAKAGLIGLTQSLAQEVGSRNVRVNCILPGFMETRMTRDLPAAALDRAREMHALGRFNTVEDAARFVEFLHTMGTVSGQVFQLDSRLAPWC